MKVCIRIEHKPEGYYAAECPSLPGCRVRAWSRKEATEKLDEAIRGYVAAVSDFVPDCVVHEVEEA